MLSNDSTRFRKACIFTTQKALRENTCTIASGDYSTPVSQRMDRMDAYIEQGSAEIWTIRNGGTRWEHPIHIHFEEFQILEFNGKPLKESDVDNSRKDVLTLGPGDEVKLFFHFRDFLGCHVMHCHNVVHEDHTMMIHWHIDPPKHGPVLGAIIEPRPVMRLGTPPAGL